MNEFKDCEYRYDEYNMLYCKNKLDKDNRCDNCKGNVYLNCDNYVPKNDIYFCKALNELHDEKEAWKQSCCSNSNFNSILLHELDIAQEQGFEVSNPFKQFLEDREDVE